MNVRSWIRMEYEVTPLALLLVLGDLLAIGAFVVAGEIQHGYDPIADFGRVVGTYQPFLFGWLAAGVVGGLFTDSAVASIRRAVTRTVPAWVLAVVVAQLLRATPVFHGDAALTFALVAAAVGGALLVAWRLVVAALLAVF